MTWYQKLIITILAEWYWDGKSLFQWPKPITIQNGKEITLTFPISFLNNVFSGLSNQYTLYNERRTIDNTCLIESITLTSALLFSNDPGGVSGTMTFFLYFIGV